MWGRESLIHMQAQPFWGSKILNFRGFRKNNIFWGMNILWIFFWRHHKIGLVLGVFSMYFWVFS